MTKKTSSSSPTTGVVALLKSSADLISLLPVHVKRVFEVGIAYHALYKQLLPIRFWAAEPGDLLRKHAALSEFVLIKEAAFRIGNPDTFPSPRLWTPGYSDMFSCLHIELTGLVGRDVYRPGTVDINRCEEERRRYAELHVRVSTLVSREIEFRMSAPETSHALLAAASDRLSFGMLQTRFICKLALAIAALDCSSVDGPIVCGTEHTAEAIQYVCLTADFLSSNYVDGCLGTAYEKMMSSPQI